MTDGLPYTYHSCPWWRGLFPPSAPPPGSRTGDLEGRLVVSLTLFLPAPSQADYYNYQPQCMNNQIQTRQVHSHIAHQGWSQFLFELEFINSIPCSNSWRNICNWKIFGVHVVGIEKRNSMRKRAEKDAIRWCHLTHQFVAWGVYQFISRGQKLELRRCTKFF